MGWRSTFGIAVLVGALGLTSGCASSQEHPAPTPPAKASEPAAAPAAAPAMPSEEEMMKMMAEMAMPTEEHKRLAAMAGTWDSEMTMFEPGKPPHTEKGVTTATSVLNGLYVRSEHEMTMGGQPFKGIGFDGYSKEKKRYFTFWADQMGTTPMFMWGTEDGKTITYDGDVYDCGPMGLMTPRVKITHDDADHYTFEFWAKMGGATEYAKMMEGKYTRRK